MFESLPNSPAELQREVMVQSIAALKLNTFLDNFDIERFNIDGIDHSMEFDANSRAYFMEWFVLNHVQCFETYSSLSDDTSKRLFMHLLAYRLAGHHSWRIPVGFSETDNSFAAFQTAARFTPSTLATSGMFGNMKHFDFSFEGHHYRVDCIDVKHYLHRRQYFFDRDGVRVQPEPGDVVVDGGACLGDTAAVFSNAVGEQGKVFAFDPVHEHLEVLAFNAAQFPWANVQVMPYGLSDNDVCCAPMRLNSYSPGFSSANQRVPLRSIDSLVASGDIDQLDFLKLDVEGFELNVLKGAANAIDRFHPKMAVSLYHKPNDLFELPQFIKQRFPFYDFRLEHYTIHAEETVLYCLPRA